MRTGPTVRRTGARDAASHAQPVSRRATIAQANPARSARIGATLLPARTTRGGVAAHHPSRGPVEHSSSLRSLASAALLCLALVPIAVVAQAPAPPGATPPKRRTKAAAAPAAPRTLPDTLATIKAARQINVAFSGDSLPFSFVGDGNQPAGYSIDLCKRVIAQLGRVVGVPDLKVNWLVGTVAERIDDGRLRQGRPRLREHDRDAHPDEERRFLVARLPRRRRLPRQGGSVDRRSSPTSPASGSASSPARRPRRGSTRCCSSSSSTRR